jgi:Tn7-like transposition protein D/TniQ
MDRLLYFPEPYPDEDFRSILFRYHIRSGNSEIQQTKMELFGINSDKVGHIPRSLMTLVSKLPGDKKMIAEELISYTWYPFFKKFLLQSRKEAVENDILYGKNNRDNYAGKVAMQRNSPILSNVIKYCPLCMREDYQSYGEVYLHLSHQLSFLQFCPKHLIKLTERCPICKKHFSKSYATFLTSVPCCKSSLYERIKVNKIVELQLFLLKEVIYIKDKVKHKDSHELYTKIISILNNNGYITLGGVVKKTQLIDDFLSHYPEEFLTLIGISKEKIFKLLLNKNGMIRIPLVYILLISYLKGSIQNFFEEDGGGVILLSQDGCELINVVELKGSGNKETEFAVKVNIGKKSVNNYVSKEQLGIAQNEVAATLDADLDEIDINKRKRIEKIIQIIINNPGLNRTQLQKLSKKDYRWVLKNDIEWFNYILPPLKRKQLDYAVLDNELRIKVRDAAQLTYKLNPSTQIKRYSILNKLSPKDKNRIVAHLNRLPGTLSELEKYEESKVDYQIRHIPKLVSQLKSSGYVNVTLNSILSFRRSYRNCSEETKKRIEETLISIQECDIEK